MDAFWFPFGPLRGSFWISLDPIGRIMGSFRLPLASFPFWIPCELPLGLCLGLGPLLGLVATLSGSSGRLLDLFWVPFGSLVGLFGSLLDSFGSILNPF